MQNLVKQEASTMVRFKLKCSECGINEVEGIISRKKEVPSGFKVVCDDCKQKREEQAEIERQQRMQEFKEKVFTCSVCGRQVTGEQYFEEDWTMKLAEGSLLDAITQKPTYYCSEHQQEGGN